LDRGSSFLAEKGMLGHKIIGLLKSFTWEEILKFDDFLSSPYYNKNKKLLILYRELVKFYPDFESDEFNKESIYRNVYKTERYNDSTFRNLAARLLKLAQTFILTEYHNEDKVNSMIHLTSALFNRDQNELFQLTSKRISLTLDQTKEIDFNYLFNKFQHERNQYNFNIVNDKLIQKKKIYPPIEKLTNSSTYLTIYFITEIICQYLNYIVYSEKFNSPTHNYLRAILDSLNMDEIYREIRGKNDCDFILNIYINLYKMFSEPGQHANFFKYKALIDENSRSLSGDEIAFHYSKLISYCILQRERTYEDVDYNTELFELYESSLKNKYYKSAKYPYLSPALYRDILLFGLNLKKFDWVKDFIDKFSSEVHPNEIKSIYNFGRAFYNFELGNFSDSLDFVNKISIDHFIYKYDLKNLRLRIFYELDYTEEALYITHSYKEFLRNNDLLSDGRKKRYRNFIKYYEKLVFIKTGNNKDVDFFKYEISNNPELQYKDWFLKKIDELTSKGNFPGRNIS
jgi:hypothetical protein